MTHHLTHRHPQPPPPDASIMEVDGGSEDPLAAKDHDRRAAGLVLTGLAGLLVLAVLLAPRRPIELVRIPVEGLVVLGLVLVARGRGRTGVAAVLGVWLGLWAVLRIVDIAFTIFVGRSFDPVLDRGYLGAGVAVLRAGHGPVAAIAAVVGAVLVALAVVAGVVWAVLRLSGFVARHRLWSARTLLVLGVAWVVLFATGAQFVAGEPIAAHDGVDRLGQVRTSLGDRDVFAAQVADDPYRDTPGAALLGSLRGKDVLVVLVESYGRAALEQPEVAPEVTRVLTTGEQRLRAAGFGARSAFLTSSTFGGGSWLAYATLLTGAWVTNQDRYEAVAASDRLPLTGAFHRAGWRTVADMPGTKFGWLEAPYYTYDQVNEFNDFDYAGPLFSFDTMPDQYVLSHFQRTERASGPRTPVMAVLELISSHSPWEPVPPLVGWDEVGDGSAYPLPDHLPPPAEAILSRDPARVRADYAHATSYTLAALLSYVQTYGDDDLVVVFVGDHQPNQIVAGDGADHDVPISILARDPAVLDDIAAWGWPDGLIPAPDAPLWRMDTFRDRFLAAFS